MGDFELYQSCILGTFDCILIPFDLSLILKGLQVVSKAWCKTGLSYYRSE